MPTYKQIFMVFLKMGAFAFGGVYAMLALFQRELVDKRKWLQQDEFAEGVAIGQMTPGPPIINTGIYVGYHLKGSKGALAATAGQVLPGFVLVLVLAYVYKEFKDLHWFSMVLKGIGAAVVGLLASVVFKMGKKIVRGRAAVFFAAGGFILLHFLNANPIALIALSGATGYLLYGRPK